MGWVRAVNGITRLVASDMADGLTIGTVRNRI